MAAEGGKVRFEEAIDFLRGKVNMPTARWDDLRHGAQARAFTVAGVTRDDMLADFRQAIEAARQGGGLADFRKAFDEIVDRTGWTFNARGKTEEERRDWRATLIYKTNMRTSYMAGVYRQLTNPSVLRYRPYWRYRHSGSQHPRKTHLALDGLVFRADDPIWDVYFPPNGFGCFCDVEALSERDLRALGKTGPDERPAWMEPYEGIDRRTGLTETRWPGVDRGWEYNVGKEWLAGIVPVQLRQPLPPFGAPAAPPPDLPALPEPRPVAPGALLPDGVTRDEAAEAFLAEAGVGRRGLMALRDRSGAVVPVTRALFSAAAEAEAAARPAGAAAATGPQARLLAQAIADPDEIWADWAELASAVLLRRTYVRRFRLPDRRVVTLRFGWTSKGWAVESSTDLSAEALAALRRGVLLYRRVP